MMRDRCSNPSHIRYRYYGGKGIKVKMTVDDLVFLWERDKASAMKKASIDRIDSDKDYVVENCRFVELLENTTRARRALCEASVKHIRKSIASGLMTRMELSKLYNVSYSCIKHVLRRRSWDMVA
jgi:hypothetical protein